MKHIRITSECIIRTTGERVSPATAPDHPVVREVEDEIAERLVAARCAVITDRPAPEDDPAQDPPTSDEVAATSTPEILETVEASIEPTPIDGPTVAPKEDMILGSRSVPARRKRK